MSITALRSRKSKVLSKEPKTQPAIVKCDSKRKVQTLSATIDKSKEILLEASTGRVRRLANNKRSVRPCTSEELEKLLKTKHVVHSSRERTDWSDGDVRRYCVRELLKEGFLNQTPWGEYKVAPERLVLAS